RAPVFHQSCTTVPRGGSAAFLAPLPLSFLPIDAEVQGMLQTCGVKTLGDFAALPPPSVSRAWTDVDFRALARGQGTSTVRGATRAALLGRHVIEQVVLPPGAGEAVVTGGAGAAGAAGEAGETIEAGEETAATSGADAWTGALHTL